MWKVLSSIPRGLKWPGAKPTPSPQVIWDDDQSRLQREPPSADPAPREGACRLHTCGPGGGRGKDAEEQDEWSRQKAHHEDYFCGLDEKSNLLGAMGWGTAVVLGLQYVHFKGKKMYAEDFKSRCPVQRVFGMPQTCGLGTTTSKSVLPSKTHAPSQHHEEGEGHLVSTESCPLVGDLSHQDLVEEIVEDVLSSCTYLEDDLESGSQETTCVDEDVLTKQEQKQCSKPEDLLADAFREFETIAVTYRSVSENISGLEKAGSGEYREAMKHWRVASDAGYAKAAYNLGICYQLGRGTQKDLHQAAGYFRMAAERGHREAQFNLGMMYLEGAGCLKRNTSFATELLDNAAQQGLLQAQLFLGKFYTETDNENFEKAASYFYSAAEQKDSEGLYSLGVCYENGLGVDCNECKAAELYWQAAKLGHTGATYNLAVFHENGLGGLPLDVTAAKELYKRASDAGHENAKHNLQRLQALGAVRVWQDVFEKQSIFGTKQSRNRGIHLSASTSRLTGREKEGLDSLIHYSTSSPTLNSRNLTANFLYTFNGLSRDHLSSGDALISSASPRFPSLGDSGVSFGNQSKNDIAPMFYIGEEEVKQSTMKCTDLYGESLQSSSQNFPSLVF